MSVKKKSKKNIAWLNKVKKYLPKGDIVVKVLAGGLALLMLLSLFTQFLY
jgi:hypothetical protein